MKTPEPYNGWDIQVAQRLYCSAISVQTGISYQHCWKTYVGPAIEESGGNVPPVYLECARKIRENFFKDRGARFSTSV